MHILLCRLLFKFKVMLGTFPHAIKYTFTTWFFNGSTLWMHHNIFNWFPVIGYLFSSTFLSIINNVMIDKLEHKSWKAVLSSILFYMYRRSGPTYPFCHVFALGSLTYFFPVFVISEILRHDDEMFIHLGYLWSLVELFEFCALVNTLWTACIFQRWLNLCILFSSINLH